MPADGFDVVVVGGGSAGCALAGRLAADPACRVLLLEAGPPGPLPVELRQVASLAATAPDHPLNWAHAVTLRAGQDAVVPRGRVLGGSSAVNGAVWLRATPADCAGWGPGWGYADLMAHYVAAETDHDHPGPGHGSAGPIPVRRPAGTLLHPAAERFLIAAQALGFPAVPDKNAGGPPGAGLVPANVEAGRRVDAATAYLRPRPGLTVRTGAIARRVLLARDRAVGVELRDGTRVHAAQTVLCAGAVGTPALLLASGIGPADELCAAGIEARHDLPGVGRDGTDHPAVFLPFRTADPPAHPHAPSAQAALDLDAGADPAGDVEILLFARPFVDGGDLHLMCLLQHPDSRGAITLPAADGPPRIEYRYLRTEHDRRRLRHAVRTGAELLRAGLGIRTDPGGDVLGNDRALDGWLAAHLSTAVHLCGGAAIGPAADAVAVVDADLWVHGIDGLRVADTSVLPTAPRRGPAATAVAIGEKAAQLVGADR
ncbi:MAG: mycofactocin dehydrogenase MftG [Pseudonocardia sp.]